MTRHSDWDPACKVFIGGLGNRGDRAELEDKFSKFGNVKNVWVAMNPAGFAFVEMEDPTAAEKAVYGLNDTDMCGNQVNVEMSNGRKKEREGGDGDYRRRDDSRDCRRNDYRKRDDSRDYRRRDEGRR